MRRHLLPSALLLTLTLAPGAAWADEFEPDADADDGGKRGIEVGLGFDLFSWIREGDETHLRILDFKIVSLVEMDSDGDDQLELRVIDTPILDVFTRERDGEAESTEIVGLPFFSLFRSESNADEQEVSVVELPLLGSLYRYATDGFEQQTDVLFLIRTRSGEPAPIETDVASPR